MTVLLVAHSIIVVLLIGVILVQRSSQDGFASGGMDAFMSNRAQANLMTRATTILAASFLLTSLALAYMATHTDRNGKSLMNSLESTKPVTKQETPASLPAANTKPAPKVPTAE